MSERWLRRHRQQAKTANGAREAVLAWAASPGFAAMHNGKATNEEVVDNLIEWLAAAGFEIGPTAHA